MALLQGLEKMGAVIKTPKYRSALTKYLSSCETNVNIIKDSGASGKNKTLTLKFNTKYGGGTVTFSSVKEVENFSQALYNLAKNLDM